MQWVPTNVLGDTWENSGDGYFKVVIENKTVISVNMNLSVSFCNLLF